MRRSVRRSIRLEIRLEIRRGRRHLGLQPPSPPPRAQPPSPPPRVQPPSRTRLRRSLWSFSRAARPRRVANISTGGGCDVAQRVVLVAVRASPADAAVAALVLLDSFAVAVAFESRRRRSGEASVPASGGSVRPRRGSARSELGKRVRHRASASAPPREVAAALLGASRGARLLFFLGGHHLEAFTAPLGDVRSVVLGVRRRKRRPVAKVAYANPRLRPSASVLSWTRARRRTARENTPRASSGPRTYRGRRTRDELEEVEKVRRTRTEPAGSSGPVPQCVADRVAAAPRRRRGRAGR